jgi:F420-dependent oxidoreductase-like protein
VKGWLAMDLRIFTEPQNGASYDTLLAVAREAESLGFDAFFRSDHYMTFDGDGLPGPSDAWTTLAGLARDTTRIRLGTLVTPVTFRLPGPLAIIVAGVDNVSGGRVELGLGTGWNEPEHAAYGVPFPPTRMRFDQLAEQLDIITGLWRTPVGKTFSHRGAHYTLSDCPGLPKPTQPGGPPIIIGGWGAKRTPALVAQHASEYNVPFGQPKDAASRFEAARTACETTGRDPASLTLSVATTICCGRDQAEITRRAAATGQPLDNLRQYQTCGTPAEVIDRINAFAKAGATRVYLQVLDLGDLDHVGLIGTEVLPAVAAL